MSSDSSATRDTILEAGLRILAEEGHDALTVRRVATEAGCSTIGVYTWFGGKDGLIDAIWQAGFASFADALLGARASRGPLGRLRGQARAYRTWALAHSMHYSVMFLKAIPGFVPSEQSAAIGLRAYMALRDLVVDALAEGGLRTGDPDAIALVFWGGVHGLVSLEIIGGAVGPYRAQLSEKTYRLMVDVLVRGLAP